MLSREVDNTEKRYTPSTDRRETRSMRTQAMYQIWRDEYALLQEQYPEKNTKWYSMKIARMPIAEGRDSETIRKQLK